MTILGFTFVKNATKLYIPAVEAIRSVLPICDEFVIAIGDNDPDDYTTKLIEEIGDPKTQAAVGRPLQKADIGHDGGAIAVDNHPPFPTARRWAIV